MPHPRRRTRRGHQRGRRRPAGSQRAVPAARRPGGAPPGRQVPARAWVEAACARALAAGDPTYRTVKGILAAGTDRDIAPELPAGDGGAAAHLRGPAALLAHDIQPDIAAQEAAS